MEIVSVAGQYVGAFDVVRDALDNLSTGDVDSQAFYDNTVKALVLSNMDANNALANPSENYGQVKVEFSAAGDDDDKLRFTFKIEAFPYVIAV